MEILEESSTQPTQLLREIKQVVSANRQLEGGGFEVYRPFPSRDLPRIDPFLLLDEMAPRRHEPGKAIGAPPHPHRGFETVTYVLEGEIEHRDSAGNHGIIGPGDVQWMTAGDGIIHSEMPSERIQTEGGVGHGLQLWVNLPASLRRTPPAYQALSREQMATASGAGWSAAVIAGSLFGVDGPARTHTPIGLARITVQAGTALDIDVAEGHTAAIYVFAGTAMAGADGQTVGENQLVVFDQSRGAMRIAASRERDVGALVMTGEPIGEPIARYGPFVMNTRAEIEEAIDDFTASGSVDRSVIGVDKMPAFMIANDLDLTITATATAV